MRYETGALSPILARMILGGETSRSADEGWRPCATNGCRNELRGGGPAIRLCGSCSEKAHRATAGAEVRSKQTPSVSVYANRLDAFQVRGLLIAHRWPSLRSELHDGLTRTAIHEAGHVIPGLLRGDIPLRIEVHPGHGQVVPDDGYTSRATELAITLAGDAAERMYFRATSGSDSDFAQVAQLLRSYDAETAAGMVRESLRGIERDFLQCRAALAVLATALRTRRTMTGIEAKRLVASLLPRPA